MSKTGSKKSPAKRARLLPRQPREGAEWLTAVEAAWVLGLSPQTLAKWRCTGATGPPWHRPSGRIVRYLRSDCEAFLRRGGAVTSTTGADAQHRHATA